MEKYSARTIFNLTESEIWNLPQLDMLLEFDDGAVIETTGEETIFSWYCGIYLRMYPQLKILPKHHIHGEHLTKDTHLTLLGYGLFDVIDALGSSAPVEELELIAYQQTNLIYNTLIDVTKPYVSTISILDFVVAGTHPKIAAANAAVTASQSSIDGVYHTIKEVLKDPNELIGNTIAHMAKSGLVSLNQILQCIGPRGYITDVDSNIFKEPILTGYAQGILKLSDSLKESRSASKALFFAKDPVAETEYFNREMQLMTSIVTRIHRTDCGSTEYLNFKVRSSDLSNLAGKYYKTDTGGLAEFMEGDKHLIGKLIQFRSSLKCHHIDHYGVCEVCMGILSKAVPDDTNLGHSSGSVLNEKGTQNVLSTKHFDGSSKVDDFVVSRYDSKFIRSMTMLINHGSGITPSPVLKLSEDLIGKNVSIILAAASASNLSDIIYHQVDKLVPSNVSSMTEVIFRVTNAEGFDEDIVVPVSMGSRLSSLSTPALTYIKEHGWELDDKGNYVINFDKWDNDAALFELPVKHTDMVQYMKQIKSFIMNSSSPKKIKKLPVAKRNIDKVLLDFYKLISSKLNVNIAHLEIILLSTMITKDGEDHRLPRPISEGESGSYGKNMDFRSMAVSMAYERQTKRLTDPRSFIIKNRPDSLFDNLLCPYPVINPRQ